MSAQVRVGGHHGHRCHALGWVPGPGVHDVRAAVGAARWRRRRGAPVRRRAPGWGPAGPRCRSAGALRRGRAPREPCRRRPRGSSRCRPGRRARAPRAARPALTTPSVSSGTPDAVRRRRRRTPAAPPRRAPAPPRPRVGGRRRRSRRGRAGDEGVGPVAAETRSLAQHRQHLGPGGVGADTGRVRAAQLRLIGRPITISTRRWTGVGVVAGWHRRRRHSPPGRARSGGTGCSRRWCRWRLTMSMFALCWSMVSWIRIGRA